MMHDVRVHPSEMLISLTLAPGQWGELTRREARELADDLLRAADELSMHQAVIMNRLAHDAEARGELDDDA